jgi:hypothetical protein
MTTLVTLLSDTVDSRDVEHVRGGVLIGHEPNRAPLAYRHILYEGATAADLEEVRMKYLNDFNYAARALLSEMNGARLFSGKISFRGYVGALRRDLEDRLGQPVSLDYGNRIGRPKRLPQGDFVVGGLVGEFEVSQIVASSAGTLYIVGNPPFGCPSSWSTVRDGVVGIVRAKLRSDLVKR